MEVSGKFVEVSGGLVWVWYGDYVDCVWVVGGWVSVVGGSCEF